MSEEGLINELVVPFGDGGLVTYPVGYKGMLLKIIKKTHIDENNDENDIKENETKTESSIANETTNDTIQVDIAGDAMDFFSKLKQLEASKAPIGRWMAITCSPRLYKSYLTNYKTYSMFATIIHTIHIYLDLNMCLKFCCIFT